MKPELGARLKELGPDDELIVVVVNKRDLTMTVLDHKGHPVEMGLSKRRPLALGVKRHVASNAVNQQLGRIVAHSQRLQHIVKTGDYPTPTPPPTDPATPLVLPGKAVKPKPDIAPAVVVTGFGMLEFIAAIKQAVKDDIATVKAGHFDITITKDSRGWVATTPTKSGSWRIATLETFGPGWNTTTIDSLRGYLKQRQAVKDRMSKKVS